MVDSLSYLESDSPKSKFGRIKILVSFAERNTQQIIKRDFAPPNRPKFCNTNS